MPADGVTLSPKSNLLTTDEILKVAKLFVGEGVKKIRLTGGEPTVRKDLLEVVNGLNALRKVGLESIAMTTNGIALKRMLKPLKENGLDNVNISLDTLDPLKFQLITRRKGLERVLESLDEALALEFGSVKLNCVLLRGRNDDEVFDFIKLTEKNNLCVRFIEYMPFDGNAWKSDKLVPYFELLDKIKQNFEIEKATDSLNDTTKGHAGTFGVISSMTNHFCHSCNRLRITADGNLKVCLFGNSEISLRDLMRKGSSDEYLLANISAAVQRKKKQHAGMRLAFAKAESRLSLTSARCFSTLTHIDTKGNARIVDISEKKETKRTACASAVVRVGSEAYQLIKQNNIAKGDVLSVAQIAGIMAAKKTSDLIPLCHPLLLSNVQVKCTLIDCFCVEIIAKVTCKGSTGVEMEAMTAVSVASLTIYDMCKAVNKAITIEQVQLISKTGGKSDFA